MDKIQNKKIIKNIKENDILIILNYDELYKYDKNFIENYKKYTRNITLAIEDIDKKSNFNIKRQGDILVYTKQEKILEDIDNIEVQNELIHSKLNLKINSYTFLSEKMKDKTIEILKSKNKKSRGNDYESSRTYTS